MNAHRIRNLIPPVYGVLVLAGFLISATVGIIVVIVGGSLSGLLWANLSRGGDTAAGRRGDRAARRTRRR